MKFSQLIPSIFYTNLIDGKALFVDCLQFKVIHEELNITQPYCVVDKDGLGLMIFEDEKLAQEHYPELRLVTQDIDEVYPHIVATHPHLLHPNLDKVTLRPWGAKEFAILDKQVGIRFQQW